jgi:hypothetical protein
MAAFTPTPPSPIEGEGLEGTLLHVPPPRWGRLGKGEMPTQAQMRPGEPTLT